MKHYKIMLRLHFHTENDCVIWTQISNSKYIIIIGIIIIIMCCIWVFLFFFNQFLNKQLKAPGTFMP